MSRLAGYTRDGDELSDSDVLSDDEMAADYANLRQQGRPGPGSDALRRLRRAQLRVDEYGYDRDGNYHVELDGGVR